MSELSSIEVTRYLREWRNGDETALARLTESVYVELHRIARAYFAGERAGHLLQPSALVNEAYIRLLAGQPVDWENRRQFFGYSATLMRQILIDFARAQETAKRGYRSPHLSVENVAGGTPAGVDLLDLDNALEELAALNERHASVVELRYFGGLDIDDTAEVLGVSEATVTRDWRAARAWLFSRLQVK